MQRALAYLRVSTEEQALSGLSLEAQEQRIRAYCVANDYEFAGVYCDAGLSGKTMDRPKLQEALALLRTGKADALVVLKLDRLSRSTRDILELADRCEKQGWCLVSLTERLDTCSAAGRLVLAVLASMAQFEREQIGERTKTALQQKRIRQELVGEVPYGYALAGNGKTLVPDEIEQATIAKIEALRRKGCSYAKIAHLLSVSGIKTKQGKPNWSSKVVWSIHRNMQTA